ncbi:hypothetical protein ACLOJK_031910 [Asimina triloba]
MVRHGTGAARIEEPDAGRDLPDGSLARRQLLLVEVGSVLGWNTGSDGFCLEEEAARRRFAACWT